MAGYRRPAKVYRLVFKDDDMEGLEVRAKSVPLGGFLDLLGLANIRSVRGIDPSKVKDVDKLFAAFAKALVSWNVEDDDGNPVPANLGGLMSLDMDFVFAVVLAWMDAIAGVPGPLGRPSNGGEPFPEASLPMVVS